MDIHLIEKLHPFQIIDTKRDLHESGFWKISEETARRAINGNIYFHRKQAEPSGEWGT
jgi:hypothetical protein